MSQRMGDVTEALLGERVGRCMEPRARQAGVQGRFGPVLFYEESLASSHFYTQLGT